MISRKWGGGSKAVWNFSENSSIWEMRGIPEYQKFRPKFALVTKVCCCILALKGLIKRLQPDSVNSLRLPAKSADQLWLFLSSSFRGAVSLAPSVYSKPNNEKWSQSLIFAFMLKSASKIFVSPRGSGSCQDVLVNLSFKIYKQSPKVIIGLQQVITNQVDVSW